MKDEIALMRDREKANKERMTQLIAENKTVSVGEVPGSNPTGVVFTSDEFVQL